MTWKIWYGDGSVVSSQDSTWINAPREGVQVVIVYYDDGSRMLASGADGYILVNDKVWGIQLPVPELMAAANQLAAKGRLKFGLFISNENYERILKEATNTWQ